MQKKRQALTFIEMMLVILLIGVVGGALAFNLKGAVRKGKQFKTEETRKKIDSILNLALLEGHDPKVVEKNWISYVKSSPLIQVKGNPDQIYDAFGDPYVVKLSADGQNILVNTQTSTIDEESLF